MKALVVYCHPNPQSFVATVRDTALAALTTSGHDVRLVDLYAEGFNPVMGMQERLDYHTAGTNELGIEGHLEHLRWCDALIFVYPTWWYGQPAMLKGWLDRVWVPHATFTMPEGAEPIGGVLKNIRSIIAVSTLGSPWWYWKVLMGEPGRRVLLRGLPILCGPKCKTQWIAMHKMDSATPKDRKAFLTRVKREISKLI